MIYLSINLLISISTVSKNSLCDGRISILVNILVNPKRPIVVRIFQPHSKIKVILVEIKYDIIISYVLHGLHVFDVALSFDDINELKH